MTKYSNDNYRLYYLDGFTRKCVVRMKQQALYRDHFIREKRMNTFNIMSHKTKRILFSGQYRNFKSCLEDAVHRRVALEHGDFTNKDLSNVNLDEAIAPFAKFSHSNLSGANMSEALLNGSDFSSSALYNTCFHSSNLKGCNFKDAHFGGTDIHGASLGHSEFSTLSCFTLDFIRCREMKGAVFINPDGQVCSMSRPPVIIKGWRNLPVILMDDVIKSGHSVIDAKRVMGLLPRLSKRLFEYRYLEEPKEQKA